MTHRRRLFLLVLVVVLGVLSTVPGVSSKENETFGITPYPEETDGVDRGAFRIPLETGETFEDAVRIYNQTVQELELTVYAADAEAGSGETDISPVTVGFRNDEPKGLGSWIDLSRKTVQLAPRDEVIVSFRVQVKAADPTPAHGAIVVETQGNGTGGARREFLNVLSVPPGFETTSDRIRPLLLRSPWIVVAMLGLVVAIALVWIGARRARRPKDALVPAGEIDQPELEDGIPDASRPVIKHLGAADGEGATPEPLPAATTTVERRRGSSRREQPLLEDAFLVEVDPPEEDDEDTGDEASDDEEPDLFVHEDDYIYEDDDEEDLPPARRRPAPKPKAKQPARRSKTSTATKKKPARPSAAKRAPARKQQPNKKVKPRTSNAAARKRSEPRGYIPLDDL